MQREAFFLPRRGKLTLGSPSTRVLDPNAAGGGKTPGGVNDVVSALLAAFLAF